MRADRLRATMGGMTSQRVTLPSSQPVDQRAVEGRPRLLIAHDGSASADEAIKRAAELFPGAHATIVHAARHIDDWRIGPYVWVLDKEAYGAALVKGAHDRLDTAVTIARARGLDAEGMLRTEGGRSWHELLDGALEEHADLIVLGKQADGRFGSRRLGSVAQTLAAHTTVPTLVVRPGGEPPIIPDPGDPMVAIAYDGTAGAVRAIEVTAQLFPGARVVIVSVWEPLPAWMLGPMALSPGFREDFEEELVNATLVAAEDGARRAKAAGLDAEPVAAMASHGVWRELVRIASDRHVGVLGVGARSRGLIASTVLGSVAHSIVAEAPMTVLLAPPKHVPG
jgi:nucleotide-binding universal stress UspA family protein